MGSNGNASTMKVYSESKRTLIKLQGRYTQIHGKRVPLERLLLAITRYLDYDKQVSEVIVSNELR